MAKKNILIVEDDTAFGTMLKSWFTRNQFEAELCRTIENAKKVLKKESIHLVMSDYRLPDGNGLNLLGWMKDQTLSPQTPLIIMTSYAETQNIVEAIKMGAFDYLEKPINPSILQQKIEQALKQVMPANEKSSAKVEKQASSPDMVRGVSVASKQMNEHIELVAPTSLSVLIRGESGTGKEYVARAIHQNSLRKGKPFLALDCGSLSKELAPSELFGHLKGSFTSATDNKKGAFEQANGGTLFLDEIGNLSYDVQVQLLRAVQERKVRPVGSSIDSEVDVRLIVATNENLEIAITEGRFREDLYHRLNEFTLFVPSLRERIDDLPLFADFFLRKANEELGKCLLGFAPECLRAMKDYAWSGNLRELRNLIRRMALFAKGEQIGMEQLPEFITRKESKTPETPISLPAENDPLSLKPKNEKIQIEDALRMAKGNKTLAARMLNIDRKTLYNKIHALGIKL